MNKNKIKLIMMDDNNIETEENSCGIVSYSQNYMNDYIDNVISRAQISVSIPLSEQRIIVKRDPRDGDDNNTCLDININEYVDCVASRANSESTRVEYERVKNKSIGRKIIAGKEKKIIASKGKRNK